MGIPLYIICCFSLAAFNIFSLYLIFESLINMSWCVPPWIYTVWDSLCFLDLLDYFFSHTREVFNYNLFKCFLSSFFLSLLLLGYLYIQMFVWLMLFQRSLRLFSILFILFSLFCPAVLISTILSSRLHIRSSASVIVLLISSREFFISFIVLFISLFAL